MAERSIKGTSSTGNGSLVHFDPPASKVTANAFGADGNFRVLAGIDSLHLTELTASSTFAIAGTTVSTTSVDLITVAVADLVVSGTTLKSSVVLAGA